MLVFRPMIKKSNLDRQIMFLLTNIPDLQQPLDSIYLRKFAS